ncbi:unnamed protein product [Polarella glacialis]|uniref:Uncharacterized protein n=1 Tax=Polarella glacialis TaxID=89957 RepID=A0A813KVZ5_POLGL|nr:unnamed protein product [Polarella glacialis]
MNGWDLLIAGRRHLLVEIEAYVHSSAHPDPYTHGDEGQLCFGAWYFHKKGGSYKSGSFKGLDLACGCAGREVYAGLLVRSVMDAQSSDVTEGPCLVVDRILKLTGKSSIADLVAGRAAAQLPADGLQGQLQLVSAAAPRNARLWKAPRVGLVLREEGAGATHSEGRPVQFCARCYRFSTVPQRLRKWRVGFAAAAYLAGDEEAAHRLGLPKCRLQEYFSAVDAGVTHSDPRRFVGKKLVAQADLCEVLGASQSSLR